MIEPGIYKLNKTMTLIDLGSGRMIEVKLGESIQVRASLGGGKCQVTTPRGDLIAMELTLKKLHLDGYLTQTSATKAMHRG